MTYINNSYTSIEIIEYSLMHVLVEIAINSHYEDLDVKLLRAIM
jgi:hypothetical protein